MPTFFLDGEEIEFEPGENVLAASLRHRREIPHYCYHPGLKVTAQCRMCLVDIVDMGNGRGMPKLQASCSTPIAEGMKVETRSEKVKHGQNLVMEFLLVNHPLDCPICDQAGECDLQNFSFTYGTGQSEMEYEKRVYGLRDVGSFIVLERNRCIHCSRCERFSKDVVGTHDFGVFLRSHELTFDTFQDEKITHRFQGNLADICPVGCIMNRDWRFKKRAWKLKKTNSICPSCSTGCNMTVEEHKNRVYRLKPRENQEVNRWWMCDEGRVNFQYLNDRKTRLLEPMARVEGRLRLASWEAVYQALAIKLGELAPRGEEVIGLSDTHATNEEMFIFKKLMAEVWQAGAPYFPYQKGEQEEQSPVKGIDPFIYTLINTDKSPNTAGAQALGLRGEEGNKGVKAALKKKIKLAIILGGGTNLSEAAIKSAVGADLVVFIGAFAGPWAEVADVLLPGYTFAEKEGTFTNKVGRVQAIHPALIPPENCRDNISIIQDLWEALGKPVEGRASAPALFDALAKEEKAFQGLSWKALGDSGAVSGSK